MTEPKWWDCTLSREETFKDGRLNPWAKFQTHEIGMWLMTHGAERCVIGEETGENGYRHWQIRVVFKKPMSTGQVLQLIESGYWTPTIVRDFYYCEKDGRYWRSWEGGLRKYQTLELYPWQNEIIERLKKQGDRRVTVLVDEFGNSGKTTLAKVITARHTGAYCPPMDTPADYMAWALAHQNAGTFVIDLPKADDQKREKALWSAVEQMKNGYLWDKRHHWQEAWIDPPAVLVLTNEEPPRLTLSADRWDIGHLEKGAILGDMMNIIHWERNLL